VELAEGIERIVADDRGGADVGDLTVHVEGGLGSSVGDDLLRQGLGNRRAHAGGGDRGGDALELEVRGGCVHDRVLAAAAARMGWGAAPAWRVPDGRNGICAPPDAGAGDGRTRSRSKVRPPFTANFQRGA